VSDEQPLYCVRFGDPFGIRELAEALANAGIECVVDTFPPRGDVGPIRTRRPAGESTQMGVYVALADRDAAHEAVHAHEQARMPGSEGETPEWADDPNRCPACGTMIVAGATSCRECGLEFLPAVECTSCGSLLDPEATTCAFCGGALPS
jgi:hypothetical protein